MPGVLDIMSCMSSVCRLQSSQSWIIALTLKEQNLPLCNALGVLSSSGNIELGSFVHCCSARSVVLSILHRVVHVVGDRLVTRLESVRMFFV